MENIGPTRLKTTASDVRRIECTGPNAQSPKHRKQPALSPLSDLSPLQLTLTAATNLRRSAISLRLLPMSTLLAEVPEHERLIERDVSPSNAKPTECDRCDSEKRCYQIMTEKSFVTREVFTKPRKAVCAAKCGKAPLPISFTGQFLLQNSVCPFTNWLRC